MKIPVRATIASIAVGSMLVVGSVAPALAAQPSTALAQEAKANNGVKPCHEQWAAAKDNSLEHLKKLGDCEIDRRLDTIATLDSRVSSAKALTDADRTALTTELGADATGLTALRAAIDADTDVTTLRADLKRIATDFRIYLLVVPQVREVIAADTELAAVSRFGTVDARLQARINAAKAEGKDVTSAQADLNAMNAAVAQVSPLVQGTPAAVLQLTPAQYNAGTARPILLSSRTALVNGRSLLVQARADAEACMAALKAL